MHPLIVSYDAKSIWADYGGLVRAIKKYNWIELTEHTYAIATIETPHEVFEKLRPFLDPGANIYVIACKSPFAGFGTQASNNWLVKNLRS
jgi:hypothetical protein